MHRCVEDSAIEADSMATRPEESFCLRARLTVSPQSQGPSSSILHRCGPRKPLMSEALATVLLNQDDAGYATATASPQGEEEARWKAARCRTQGDRGASWDATSQARATPRAPSCPCDDEGPRGASEPSRRSTAIRRDSSLDRGKRERRLQGRPLLGSVEPSPPCCRGAG
jgi:hypothetical protein